MPVDAVPDQPQDAAIGLFDHPLSRPIGCRHLALGQHIGNALMARHAQRCDPVAIPPSPKAKRWLDPVPLQLCCAVCGVQFHAAAGRVHAPMQVAVRGAQQAFRSCGAGLPMPWRTVFNVAEGPGDQCRPFADHFMAAGASFLAYFGVACRQFQ